MRNKLAPSAATSRQAIAARIGLIAGLCLAFGIAPADARAGKTLAALQQEPSTRLDGVDLLLNGAGLRNFLFLDVYVIALYLPQRASDTRAVLNNDLPRRVRITLLRDVSAERDLEFLLEGLKLNNTPDELAAIQLQLDHFLRMIRSLGTIPKGSYVQLDYLPHAGTRVWLNQRLLGNIPGTAFNRSLLKVWLGEQPTQASLKRALLGEAGEAF